MIRKTLTHDEAVLEVYRLTPQIQEYDEFMYMGVRWLPYTMFFHLQNYKSQVINTDEFGFRLSDFRGRPVSVGRLPEGPVNLIVGGSTTLGTGATHDGATLASRLAAHTGEPWLNFGGRGYNAVQEVLMFMMHQHRFPKINNVVVYSGINTLTLEGLPDELATEHGRYYYSYEYQHYMDQYNEDLKRRARSYASDLTGSKGGRLARLWESFKTKDNPADIIFTDAATDTPTRVDRAAWVVGNALKQWQLLLARSGAKLSFVLQPMSYWTRDHLTEEEADVFHAIDSCPNNFWRLFANILAKEVHPRFAGSIASVCAEQGIPFFDSNQMLKSSPLLNETLFVDRVHFNDRGYDEAARQVAEVLPATRRQAEPAYS
jgi:hypothetical protein